MNENSTIRKQHARNIGIDFARVLACLGVLTLHLIGRDSGPVSGCVYFLSGFSIPVFFMASGYFVLNRSGLGYGYALRKTAKILPTVFLWVCVMSVLKSIIDGYFYNPFVEIVKALLQRGVFSILWFFWALLLIYAAAPVLSALIRRVGSGLTAVAFGLGAICVCVDVLSVILCLRGGAPLQQNVPQTLRLWTWLFYFSLGGVLGNEDVKMKMVAWFSPRRAALLLAVSSFLVVIWEFGVGYHMLSVLGAEYFYDDPASMLWSFAIFVTCDVSFERLRGQRPCASIIECLAPLTMGIYVTHAFARLFIACFYDLSFQPLNFALVPLVFLSCAAATYILMRFKLTKRLVSL